MDEPLLVQIGPYVLTRRLSEGGMGSLYVGHLEGDEGERELAIKVIDPAFSDNNDYVQAFRRESETASRIDHPNVVHVIDRGEDDGAQFLVMELLRGRSLAELFVRGRAEDSWISPELAIWVMARAAEGLHYVHDTTEEDGTPLNMVHGDVSPQNIFLTSNGEVKIIDFGLAHSAIPAAGDDSPAKLYGKVHYLSPEQCSGSRFDRRADVFALGATLYEALTTHSAFSAGSKFLVMMRISQGQSDPIREHLPDVDPDLETIIERSLAYQPNDRLRDAQVLENALDSWLLTKGMEVGAKHVARYMDDLFGGDVDAADDGAAPARRRSTQPRRHSTQKRRQSTERRVTDSGRRPSIVEKRVSGLPAWQWMGAGIGIGIASGIILLLLRALGLF